MTARITTLVVVLAIVLLVLPAGATSDAASFTHPVISQVYGGGGNSGASFTHDYIELFNPTQAAISLAGWSVQYASATGSGSFGFNGSQLTPLAGILEPGQYLLIQGAEGAGGTTALPTPHVTDETPIRVSATGGKIALVNTTMPLGCNGGSTPCATAQLARIVDLVGWGDANFFEGAPGPGTNSTVALFRANAGCSDTGNNAADFSIAAPTPRTTASLRHSCALALAVSLNRHTAKPGDVVEVGLSSVNSAELTVDVYFVIVLPPTFAACPGSLALVFVRDGGAGFQLACASDPPNTFPRYATAAAIPAAAALLSVTWPVGAPSGPYVFAVLATTPGAVADRAIDSGDILAIGSDELAALP